jgi:hypothetical protein
MKPGLERYLEGEGAQAALMRTACRAAIKRSYWRPETIYTPGETN